MEKIIAYEIVTDPCPNEFSEKVGARLKKGWQVYGNPYATHDSPCGSGPLESWHCQAMVKTMMASNAN